MAVVLSQPTECGSIDLANSGEAAGTITIVPNFITGVSNVVAGGNGFWWWHGKATGLLGLQPTFVVDATAVSATAFQPTSGHAVAFSYDNWETWEYFSSTPSGSPSTWQHDAAFTSDAVWFALYVPLTVTRLRRWMRGIAAQAAQRGAIVHKLFPSASSDLVVATGAGSIVHRQWWGEQNRPVLQDEVYGFRISADAQPDASKPCIKITWGTHPSEHAAHWFAYGYINFLLSDHPDAVAARKKCDWVVVGPTNPEGHAAGAFRVDVQRQTDESGANGDYNRRWHEIGNTYLQDQISNILRLSIGERYVIKTNDTHSHRGAASSDTSFHLHGFSGRFNAASTQQLIDRVEVITGILLDNVSGGGSQTGIGGTLNTRSEKDCVDFNPPGGCWSTEVDQQVTAETAVTYGAALAQAECQWVIANEYPQLAIDESPRNYLRNGGFEDDGTGWSITTGGTIYNAGLTADSNKSLYMVQGGTADQDQEFISGTPITIFRAKADGVNVYDFSVNRGSLTAVDEVLRWGVTHTDGTETIMLALRTNAARTGANDPLDIAFLDVTGTYVVEKEAAILPSTIPVPASAASFDRTTANIYRLYLKIGNVADPTQTVGPIYDLLILKHSDAPESEWEEVASIRGLQHQRVAGFTTFSPKWTNFNTQGLAANGVSCLVDNVGFYPAYKVGAQPWAIAEIAGRGGRRRGWRS